MSPRWTGAHEFAAALDAVAERLGRLDGVVVASVGTEPTLSGAVAELEPDAWTARVELPLHRTLVCFQGALGALRADGGIDGAAGADAVAGRRGGIRAVGGGDRGPTGPGQGGGSGVGRPCASP